MPERAVIWLKVVWWCKYNSICKVASTHICTSKPLLSFPPCCPRQAGNLSGTWWGEQKASSRLMMTATQKAIVFSKGGCIIYFNAAASARHWAGVSMATGCWEIAERESAGWSQWASSFSKPEKISSEQNPKARTTCSFLTATDVGGSGKCEQRRF